MLKKNYKPICNFICVVLMLVLLVLQFLPGYWTAQKSKPDKDGNYKTDVASLQGYMWVPSEYTVLDDYFDDLYGDALIMNDVVMMPIITFVFGVLGIIFCSIMNHKAGVTLLPALVGGAGVIGYLMYPIFQLNSMWIVHFIVCVLIFGVSIASLVTSVTKKIIALKNEISVKA